MNIESKQQENDLLWSEILDNSEWFVSPRGDRYSPAGDSELKGRGLDSITFSINRDYPREHIVNVGFSEIEEPFAFWLDTRRRLLDLDRKPLYADVRMREGFLNLVLRRLFSVTAKLYGTYGSHPRGEAEGGWGYDARRAHYVMLTSNPPDRIITMQSITARAHAQEILEDYGIDIYEEMVRRRRLGRLKEDQYLTFRREVSPVWPKDWIVQPNELRYNHEKVQAAISNIVSGRAPKENLD